MSEIERNNQVETEKFTDELSDEALDRETEGEAGHCHFCRCGGPCNSPVR